MSILEASSPSPPSSVIKNNQLLSTTKEVPSNSLAETIQENGLVLSEEGFVRWDNRNPKHPRNWTIKRKAYNTTTSAAQEARTDYGISLGLSIFCLTSMFVYSLYPRLRFCERLTLCSRVNSYLIGQGIGGIFFPPYSEAFGRKTLYIVSTLVYCICSVITVTVPSLAVVIIARFITGIFSAIPTIVVAGSIEDMFNLKARVWMIFSWVLIGNVSVCIGPIYSTYVTVNLGWRWVFYLAAIGLGLLFVFCLLLNESRPSLLLEREVASLRKKLPDESLRTLNPDATPDYRTLIQITLIRPLRLLFTEPIVMVVAVMGSVVCILFYGSAESLLLVFEAYGWSHQSSSLSFIPIMIGCFCGFFTRLYDHRQLERRQRSGKSLEPEHKLLGFSLAAPMLAIGLWVFAWTIPPAASVHWIVPMLTLILVGYALNENVYTLTGYLADSYTIFAASGFAGLILARATTAAVILPFTRPLYEGLGFNVATSLLAAIATVFCAAPILFWKYGKRIREASPFAKFSLSTYKNNMVEDDMKIGDGESLTVSV
ncbi:MAG: hypothetical protein Q9166_004695 [cf. Caloplaca sp. 2 TL-2023]